MSSRVQSSLRVVSSQLTLSRSLLVVISVLGILTGAQGFPTESVTPEEKVETKPTELVNYTRVEREIDLRQNLHKHLKPFVAIHSSNARRPKPIDTVLVEKPASPYFVRILKRRPGGISKESLEQLDSTEVPKVLIDRRRNKESPILPVVVIDSNGVPQRNRTVLVEKSQEEREANQFQETLEKDDYQESYASFNPSTGALQSLEDTQGISFPSSSTTEFPVIQSTMPTSAPSAAPTTPEPPVEVDLSTPASEELPISSTTSSPFLVHEIPSFPTLGQSVNPESIQTEQQSVNVLTASSDLPSIDLGIVPAIVPTTTEIPAVSKDHESFLPLKITENSTPPEELIPVQSSTTTTTEPPTQQEFSGIPGFILGPELGLQGPISADGHTFPNQPEAEFISSNDFNPSFPHQTIVPVSKESEFPVIESLHSASTTLPPTPTTTTELPSSSTPSTLDDLDSASSSSSFSTLAVTKVLPNTLSKRTTEIAQQEEAMQASEIFTQSVSPSTTPLSVTTTTISTTSTTTPTTTTSTTTTSTTTPPPSTATSEPVQISSRRIDDIQSSPTTPEVSTTAKPLSTVPPTSSTSTISNEQLQHLMKAAIARLLLQQQQKTKLDTPSQNSLLSGDNFPQVKLVESKPTRAEEVYLNPSSFNPGPRSNNNQNNLIPSFNNVNHIRPTSPMPSLLNALQKLINVTPRPTVPPPSFINTNANNNNGLFSNPLFAGLFPTTTKAPSIFDIFRNPRSSTTTNAPFFFINLRTTEPSRHTSQSELITTKIPILASVPSWHEFTGREVQPHFQQQQQHQQQQQSNKQSSTGFQLGTILMAPVNLVMGMVKGMFSIGQFMGNTINTLASAFSPNKSNRV